VTLQRGSASGAGPRDDGVVRSLFHPTFLTSDRKAMARWLRTVFGIPSMTQGELAGDGGTSGDYPTDYVLFSWVGDVWWYAADLSRWFPPEEGSAPRHSSDRLAEWGWKVRDAADLIDRFDRHGATLTDLAQRRVTSVGSMSHPISPDTHFMWTDPAQTGLAFELVDWPPGRAGYAAAWKFPPPSDDDPLGERAPASPVGGFGLSGPAVHTVVTHDLDRAHWVVVDLLGGVLLEGRRASGPPTRTFSLAGSRIEYVTPDSLPGSVDLQPTTSLFGHAQTDVYYSISLRVADFDRAVAHLARHSVPVVRNGTMATTDPDDCLGMRWCLVGEGSAGDAGAEARKSSGASG
jgi:hypothetical protein